MGYQLPVTMIVASAVLGLALDSINFIEKAKGYIFPEPLNLEQSYIILDADDYYNNADYEETDGREFLRELASELALQGLTVNFAAPPYLKEALGGDQTAIKTLFCERNKEDLESRAESVESCVENTILRAYFASYVIRNRTPSSVSDIKLVLQKYSGTDAGISNLDNFIDSPEEQNGCLHANPWLEQEEKVCFAMKVGGRTEVDLPQTLGKDDMVSVPLYVWFALNYSNEEKKISFYDGFVSSPFWLPISVKHDGEMIIEKARPMSLTPMISKGQYEIRG